MEQNQMFVKDPSEELDYQVIVVALLQEGEQLTRHRVFCDDSTITILGEHENDGVITFWLSGGNVNTTYRVTVEFETDKGRLYQRSIWVKIVER
ncbi:MAG: hypothetical protein ACOX8S_12480 [Christensenellales bacterium]|jgi:hypothetical protein